MAAKSTNTKVQIHVPSTGSDMALMRMSFSQNARIARASFEEILSARELPSLSSLVKERSDTDAIRTAVSKLVQQVSTVLQIPSQIKQYRVWRKTTDLTNPTVQEGFGDYAHASHWADEHGVLFTDELLVEGYWTEGPMIPCKLVDAPAKVPAGHLAIEFDLQARDSNVSYEKVGKLTYGSGEASDKGPKTISWTPGPAWDKIPSQLQEVLANPGALLSFGKENLFDTDLRRVAEGLIDGFVKVWSGTWLVLTPFQKERASKAQDCLKVLDEGFVKLKVLTLEASAENKLDLAEEVGNLLSRQAEIILEKIQSGIGDLKALDKEFHKLREEAELVTKSLQVPMPREWDEIRDRVQVALVNLLDDSQVLGQVA